MIRTLVALLLFGFAVATNAQTPTKLSPRFERIFPDKPSLMHGIEINEAALQQAQSTQAANATLVIIYSNLGSLYEEAALYLKSEDAMRHAIALLREEAVTSQVADANLREEAVTSQVADANLREEGVTSQVADANLRTCPQDQAAQLAAEISHLAMLHSAMDEAGEAEKDAMEALRIRESVGDPIGIALARGDLAAIYIKQHRYKKALDPAQKSYDVLSDNPKLDPADRIAAKEALAYALCGVHQCDRAIPLLQDAVQLAGDSFGADSLSVGCSSFLLGHTYWQAGDMDHAALWMQRGTQRMKVDMGWGHAMYLNAMAEYAQFLRKRGQTEAASAAELEVRRTTTVVDARSFTGRQP